MFFSHIRDYFGQSVQTQKKSKVHIQENFFTVSGQDKSRENKMTTPLKVNNFKYNVSF